MALVAGVLVAGGAVALAQEVDLRSLRGDVGRGRDAWNVDVTYDINVDEAQRAGPLDLVLYATDRDGDPVRDASGQALSFRFPLEQPTWSGDDADFSGHVRATIRRAWVTDPRHLRLNAVVMDRNTNEVLERGDVRLRMHLGRRDREREHEWRGEHERDRY